jgi:hypothetical protein
MLPPVADDRVEAKPSLPATVMLVAFVAAIVRTDTLPAVTVVGFAATVTVGFAVDAVTVTVAVAVASGPVPVAVAV